MLTAARRLEILTSHADLRGDTSDDAFSVGLALEDEYEQGLPRQAISRCPFTSQTFTMAIDTFGFDGLFWDEDTPIRPFDEQRPETYFALTGATKFNGPPESTPFPCTPGPESPFVIPRMLLHPDVKAVVSHVRIGPHDGYPIIYFADPIPTFLARFNDWGTTQYRYETAEHPELWDSIEEEQEESIDFDLAPWIEGGDLLWIAPGDGKHKLQSTVAACPYLNIEGRRSFYRIQEGRIVSESAEPPEPAKKKKAKTRKRKVRSRRS